MDFGKVPFSQLSHVNWQLPALDRRSPLGPPSPDFRLGVGAPVWNVRHWVGQIYPQGTAPKEYLLAYAKAFNCIELNTTHYRTPETDRVRQWKQMVPEDFRFHPKILQEISHHPSLNAPLETRRLFFRAMFEFAPNLGLCFLQLPPFFNPSKLTDLARFLTTVPSELRLAVEFRHPGFFKNHQLIPAAFDLLSKHQVSTVITDVAGHREVLHMSLTTPAVLVRFVGNDGHPSDLTRLQDWAPRLREWKAQGIEQIEFFLHEPEDRATPQVLPKLREYFHDTTGAELPDPHIQKAPEQISFF